MLERAFGSDLVRGVVLTDALIGTFAAAGDPSLRQNRCFLYHVIGNGTGRWDVPVGGMGALTDALCAGARTPARRSAPGRRRGRRSPPTASRRRSVRGRGATSGDHVLANVAPAVLAKLLGRALGGAPPEGAQLKINMLLARLPRLRDRDVAQAEAFAGTFHVNEGYEQLQRAYDRRRRRDPAASSVRALLPFADRPDDPEHGCATPALTR